MVNELSPAVTQDDQAIEQLEVNGRHDEQVRGGNSVRMVVFGSDISVAGGLRRLL
jgi:hypothetical protein